MFFSQKLENRNRCKKVILTLPVQTNIFYSRYILNFFLQLTTRINRYRNGVKAVFIQAFKNLAKLKRADQFRAWLFRIAANRVRDFQRKKRVRAFFGVRIEGLELNQPAIENSDNPDALEHLAREDFWKQVELLLGTLSPLEREVFLMKFMDKLREM